MTRFSYSKLSAFDQCPLKFRYQYVQQVPSKTSPALFLGQIVHDTIAAYEKALQRKSSGQIVAGVMFSTENEDLEWLHQTFRQKWMAERNKCRQQGLLEMSRSEEAIYGIRGLRMLENFYKSPFASCPYETERFLDVPLGEDLIFVGRIDRIEKRQTGFRIVDFKTGKFSERFIDFLQLHTYSWLAYQYGLKVDSTLFYFLEDDELVERPFSHEQNQRTEAALKEKCQTVLLAAQNNAFPKKKGPLCAYCDYQDLCDSESAPPL
ncbi:MAG TPA: PD-(D/E)XK nuclease family protein [Thermotogota bacterium]|jgi:CRISPR/Cas system-associated exonuclease Cas4 (RecB family)|nr:PD-(D/E)XK nuclease family protein [Thermotogota bacterium]NLH19840.1 PD-(D/E)XK nuclease family protein [Thermotogaceae bacterium]OQC30313.1 MAG: PD-(D/E)XK nuclease superfamily protein [Thermotogota bacterium ADurb.Bin062]HNW47443.1 PD-(D/E)XK nuclease family protein [Thermotogota bacterium]HNY82046.1 PD-(D/E)XK nuclease family protein [Thermotogota bacterium]